jgi:rare lipoprotein A
MKRWLIVVSLLVAGLLMVGWGGDALAARHPPSLLQKILAMFTPNKSLETVQAPPSVESMRPVETAPAAYALQGVERAEPAQAAPAAGPEPVHTTREKKGDRLKPIQLVQTGYEVKATGSVRPKPAAEKTWALASLDSVPVRAIKPAIQTGTILTTAEPAQAKPAIERAQRAPEAIHPTHAIKKPGKAQPAEIAQSAPATQPVKVAILGAPNLKAALPTETTAPLEASPADEPRSPTAKSSCNSGRRIMSAYYWEGRRTASGEPFNPRGMTAAHRTLPFGTRLNVTNPRTGKTVNVVVNDRGPFVHGVSLDLSLGAAQAIGLQGTGSVCVL